MNTEFAGRLGHAFNDPQLLQKALTHRSFYFENRGTSPGHFERLEFLGDAVLDLVLSETLMKAFPQVDEGTLSKWRASLVNEATLADVAREMEIGNYLFLGKSEDTQRANLRPRLLSSAYEAVLGALYLDAGLEKTRAFIDKQFSSRLETLDMTNEFAADFKTRLQEKTQSRYRSVPEYRMVSSEGPEHAKNFTYEVYVNDQCLGLGSGQSRKAAEQEAARDALSKENQE
ncbi:MAG: ribonuclease III [Bdellovibrionales bacterium]